MEFGLPYARYPRMNALTLHEPCTARAPGSGRVLIADDQPHILDALQILLGGHGFSIESAAHPAYVLQALESGQFDVVLMDLNYTRDGIAGADGLELVSRIRSMDSVLPVVVMTAWGSVDLAVEAMRRGATDFVQKPWENEDILQKVRKQLAWAQAQRQAQQQRDEELWQAREIQAGLLPATLPEIKGYEVAAMTRPLQFVGGDYYNIVRLSDRLTMLCIADVAGKGLPAALMMSSLQAALQPLLSQNLRPAELCERLNRILCELMPVGKFISLFYCIHDCAENRLVYSNAGHNAPLLIRGDGSTTELMSTGGVLGQFPDWLYEQNEVQMGNGATLLLFTDGLVEACNADEEPFGEDNIIRVALENSHASAAGLMNALIRASSRHSSEHLQDDASLIVLKAKRAA